MRGPHAVPLVARRLPIRQSPILQLPLLPSSTRSLRQPRLHNSTVAGKGWSPHFRRSMTSWNVRSAPHVSLGAARQGTFVVRDDIVAGRTWEQLETTDVPGDNRGRHGTAYLPTRRGMSL